MTAWPSYEVADETVVHALGVMNINYVRFEVTHVLVLAAVSNISTNQAAVFSSRINPTERATIIARSFEMRDWTFTQRQRSGLPPPPPKKLKDKAN